MKKGKLFMNKSNHVIITLLILAIIVCFAFSGCDSKDDNESVADSTVNLTETSTANETETDESENEKSDVSQESKVPTSQNDAGGAVMGLMKYRLIYYNVPLPFWELVDNQDELQEWYENLLEVNPDETNQMVMKVFLEHYNISREDFDKANLKWAKIVRDDFRGKPMMDPKDFANQETDEVFNGDIIYTFDDEIINEYYMGHPEEFYPYWYADEFEKAVEEGYTPRTTDWIDVDRMEADIIAKYGSVD